MQLYGCHGSTLALNHNEPIVQPAGVLCVELGRWGFLWPPSPAKCGQCTPLLAL